MCMKHESMHLYFFRVSLVVLNYKKRKKKQGLNWFTLESRGQDVSIQRPEDAWKVKQSPWKKQFVLWSLSKEPDLVLPPVWLCRYLCISSLVLFFFFLLFFFNSADFIVFIPLHCNVLLCRIEACTLLEKIKRILFVCSYFILFVNYTANFKMTVSLKRWSRCVSVGLRTSNI